ncbi:ubiE/COQ5 methyltransferase family protein [Rhizobium tibeticum]|uniref:Putative methyltransferase n=1 Tax=Rhizobium tibeticum TaxID=501024 RepID=A0A1H8VKM3_9HYPH|nr:class I SAM-dependent methyltransferase [Rhizobium tibeticum]SEI11081.1 putative methyltransferase [Rhizobium tibeticum]SEP15975.1 ubiE/COQ5 methyltransferase family protein [Rhizobium tibeticum]
MYDQSKLSELIRFARVDAGSTVIDVYPGDGDWTRLFSDVVGSKGRVYSFVPAEVADVKNDPVGRMQTLAKEPGRENVEAVSAASSRCRRPRNQRMCCGCTCSTTISTPR